MPQWWRGFFEAFRTAGPYKENGSNLTLVDATARDRVRGALRQLHALEKKNAPLDDTAIQQEILELTARPFEQRLIRALQNNGLTGADRHRAERLRKFMLKLHKSLIADSVKAAVYWHGRLDG
jgi:hypothetical protein